MKVTDGRITSTAEEIFSKGVYRTKSGRDVSAATVRGVIRAAEELLFSNAVKTLAQLENIAEEGEVSTTLLKYLESRDLLNRSGQLKEGVAQIFDDIIIPSGLNGSMDVDPSYYEAQSKRLDRKYTKVYLTDDIETREHNGKVPAEKAARIVNILRAIQFAGERARVQIDFNETGTQTTQQGTGIFEQTQAVLRELYETTIVYGQAKKDIGKMSEEARKWCLRFCETDEDRALFESGEYSKDLIKVIIDAISMDDVVLETNQDKFVVKAHAFDTYFANRAEELGCAADIDRRRGHYTIALTV